ncbi:Hypothetical predicted protein [Paramuricea clavata]|uniref:Uncharacterized protein n=1 Tax=Paramuricea clavata TaxID=317549 RepID=A0A6S7LNX6_PARCT|nr:Hypothetical predicted protein [Paramuricea clavata]
MIINAKKTKSMLVTGKRLAKKLPTKILSLQSENEDIEQVHFQKLLGVTIDQELTFDKHVEELSKKLGRLGVLRKIKRFLPLDQRKLYYNTMFKQVMMYGATVWANCSVENLKTILRLQKRAARIILDVDEVEQAEINKGRKQQIKFKRELFEQKLHFKEDGIEEINPPGKPKNPIEKEDKYRKRNTKVNNTQHHEARERKKILAEKKLCFNCTGTRHRAADCKSTTGCQLCSKGHHTSICETKKPNRANMMSTCDGYKVIHPIVVIKVDCVECRALVDSGAASCYASSKLLDSLGKKPTEVKYKKMEMLMAFTTTRMEIHNSTISSKSGDYELEVDLIKVNKGTLLEVENLQYKELIESYSHLKGVKIDDYDTKPYLPVHVILGAGVFTKIKTDSRPRIRKQGHPVAEHTKLGWFILSPGEESVTTRVLLMQTNHVEYDELCQLDV